MGREGDDFCGAGETQFKAKKWRKLQITNLQTTCLGALVTALPVAGRKLALLDASLFVEGRMSRLFEAFHGPEPLLSCICSSSWLASWLVGIG